MPAPTSLTPTGEVMDGVSSPQVYTDPDNARWLAKEVPAKRSFSVPLDVATSQIQQRSGVPAAETHPYTMPNGQGASVQRMFDASPAFPDNRVDLSSLSEQDTLDLQKQMALDWMLSNHDAHSGNFMRDNSTGRIVGIDKGQAFKYFGDDQLTPQFGEDVNPPLYPNSPVYSTMMNQFRNGQGTMHDPRSGELADYISTLSSIPDDEYANYLRPYADDAAGKGKLSMGDTDTFLGEAIARKNALPQSMADLYDRVRPQQRMARTAALAPDWSVFV